MRLSPKSGIALLIVLFILVFVAFSAYRAVLRQREAEKSVKFFSSIPLFNLNGTTFQFESTKALMIVLFDPTCDHCKSLAMSIRDNQISLNNYQVIWISSESPKLMEAFAVNSGLMSLSDNIDFGVMDEEAILSSFGSRTFPYIFIYDTKRTLAWEFKGVTSIEFVVSTVNSGAKIQK